VRIAYLARWDISHESGILKKMAAQVRGWLQLGHEARFFAFSPGATVWEGIDDIPLTAFHRDNLRSRIMARSAASGPVLAWKPEVVYLRWSTYYPAWTEVVKRFPTVVEINGDDVRDNRLSLPIPLYLVHRWTRTRLLAHAKGFVSVSRELARSPLYTRFGMPIEVIGNGIDLGRVEELPAPNNDTPRLVFLGYADCEWHGLDKLYTLAALFPEWNLDVVGTDAPVGGAAPPGNLRFHGHLQHRDYVRILSAADVAVGTLALHRKHLDSTSAIKTAEYLAHGIPTMIAYEDTDFRQGHPLLLQLPNTESNVHESRELIRDFVERAKGRRVDRETIAHLDIRVKERARLEFLSQFVTEE
jgi:hypothetical protein